MTSTALRADDRPTGQSADPRELAASPRVRPAGRASGPQLVMAVIGIAGVTVLALGAFGVSYPGGRQIALSAGVSAMVAGLYPVIIDAMLVVACVSALALRGAAWWMQLYAWLAVIVLVAAIGVGQQLIEQAGHEVDRGAELGDFFQQHRHAPVVLGAV